MRHDAVGSTTCVLGVADDSLREQAASALHRDGWTVAAATGTAAAALEAVLTHDPAVTVIDFAMPGASVQTVAAINAAQVRTAVIVYTTDDSPDLLPALTAGAVGFLSGPMPERLPAAMRGVIAGEAAISRGATRRLLDELRRRERQRDIRLAVGTVHLSDREAEVLELLAAGKSTAEIAKLLFIAPVTVRSHVWALRRKLRVPDREGALQLAAAALVDVSRHEPARVEPPVPRIARAELHGVGVVGPRRPAPRPRAPLSASTA